MNKYEEILEKFDDSVDGFFTVEINNDVLSIRYNDSDSYYNEEFILNIGINNMKKLADFIYKTIGENR